MYSQETGNCCYCGDECNPCSQSCGMCTRSITGYSIGLNPLTYHLRYVYNSTREPIYPPRSNDLEGGAVVLKRDKTLSTLLKLGDVGIPPLVKLQSHLGKVSPESHDNFDLAELDKDLPDEKENIYYDVYTDKETKETQCWFTESEFRWYLKDFGSDIPNFVVPEKGVLKCSLSILLKAATGSKLSNN
jgi:hypothetical protein